ncbi:hypothetical protein C8J57DRAFT_1553816 [Mycena rebaudengoi]|nr:hypothetical protein C8J57DRAFT_1553816 [Mycena rebaudengoi]
MKARSSQASPLLVVAFATRSDPRFKMEVLGELNHFLSKNRHELLVRLFKHRGQPGALIDSDETAEVLIECAMAAFHAACEDYRAGRPGPYVLAGTWNLSAYKAMTENREPSKWRLAFKDNKTIIFGDLNDIQLHKFLMIAFSADFDNLSLLVSDNLSLYFSASLAAVSLDLLHWSSLVKL